MYVIRGLPVTSKLPYEYELAQLHVFEAWQHTHGSTAVPLALVDGGSYTGIPVGTSNFCVKEYIGKSLTTWNVLTGNSTITPGSGERHAGQVGPVAVGNGGATGTRGVAYNSPLVIVKYASVQGSGPDDSPGTHANWSLAVHKAVDLGAKVIFCPQSWATGSTTLSDACDYAWSNGALVITTIGKSYASSPRMTLRYPGAYANVVCVGSVSSNGNAHGIGPAVEFCRWNQNSGFGPGVHITGYAAVVLPQGTGWQDDYCFQINASSIGSDQAGAQIAGIAQLIWSVNPALTNAQVRDILLTTQTKSPAGWRFDAYYTGDGTGIADAERAVLKAKSTVAANAGVVFPYLRVHGDDYMVSEPIYNRTNLSKTVKYEVPGDGTCIISANGTVTIEVGGYCSTGPVTDVELWIDGVQVYHGAPALKWTGNALTREHRRKALWDLRVVARTATGETATRVYETLLATPQTGANTLVVSGPVDTVAPTITAFSVPGTSLDYAVPVTFTATDAAGVTGYFLSETGTTPVAGAVGWVYPSPLSFTFAGAGTRTLYGWAKDAAGNVSARAQATTSITIPIPPDTVAPVVTSFTVPATLDSLTVPTSVTATDAIGVSGYKVTASSTAPLAGSPGWSATGSVNWVAPGNGTYTLYAWAKDAAGNVSTSMTASVTVTVAVTPPAGTTLVLMRGSRGVVLMRGSNPVTLRRGP